MFANLDRHGGGVYQYGLTFLQALDQLRAEVEPVIVHDRVTPGALEPWTSSGWQAIRFAPGTPRTITREILARVFGESATIRAVAFVRKATRRPTTARPNAMLDATNVPHADGRAGPWLRRNGIELMLYPTPSTHSFQCGVPYVMAVHDLQHRIQPQFPEVSADGEWEAREFLFANGVRHAEVILVDSDIGREDVLEFYGHLISPDRVRVLPFVLPPYLVRPTDDAVTAALSSLRLPGRYLLFPAQFWPHKNHRRVTEAIARLHRQGDDITVVMTGSASGQLRARVLSDVREIVGREGIGNLVRILGYVDDATMAALYAGASGVLLPTFFGPTNIPVIEGWAMSVPVLTSEIRGIRQQCGDAAILVDPLSTEAIAEGMRRLWTDDALRERLVVAGTERVKDNDPAAFRDELASVLSDVEQALRSRVHSRIPA